MLITRRQGTDSQRDFGKEHFDVLVLASKHVDSAVSKTCNVGDGVSYDEFKELYRQAWEAGCSVASQPSVQVANALASSMKSKNQPTTTKPPKAEACYADPATGQKSCE